MKTQTTITDNTAKAVSPISQIEALALAKEAAAKAAKDIKDAKEALAKAKQEQKEADKAAKAAKVNKPTANGSTIKLMTEKPDRTYEDLEKELTALGIDTVAQRSSIRTTYSYVRQIVSMLRTNGMMK